MPNSSLLNRQALYLRPDPTRVIVRPFKPSTEPRHLNPRDKNRANEIVDRVLSLDPTGTTNQLRDILDNFEGRHRNLLRQFELRADAMEDAFSQHQSFSQQQRQLVGAYFMNEYSFESAALFNPSIVAHPDQTGMAQGCCRVIISLRAVGEGHISSMTFRTGMIDAEGAVTIDPPVRLAGLPHIHASDGLSPAGCIGISFDSESDLSERVIFPVTEAQSNGIEDARFVAFDDDGKTVYFATYTAYSGSSIRSELLETQDFLSFTLTPLRGPAARNKGMALFPRRINGRFAMIARQDSENLFLLYSDDLHHWDEGLVLMKPEFAWQFVQIGNCGSPVEIDEGWLLFTHGVGPMRRYSIGVTLLDKEDPSIILARTVEPLLQPEPTEREGYVPNVVYSCGAIRHGDLIALPYAVSDTYSNFSTVQISALLSSMHPAGQTG
ncbi:MULTISPECIES: glycoside hydrolase family 130 protein [Rhizobium/Agrobacterium group]|uniref:glycoside hydrolase family 130 protein n=1 Tax=Rhizobium/Agrobacterium group TaxID=227290 RepID=UPI000B3F9710|nr:MULTISPECIES: glycoside hydrolase family 130 protein [Rhizobium/Agrobacterium group]MCF1480961.1 glycosidase [Allorhizobium ampelinum]NSZ44812.1 glycosidase [Agrobacterium vitis]NTA28559.1 glycosidase [Allorhizobium ampelinum]OVE93172.1 glycosidase [Allorhizobium ampelinum]